MGSSNRCTPKTTTVFLVATFFFFLQERPVNAIPTAEDINSLTEKARHTIDTFMQKSFHLRMAYQYSGKFLTRRYKEQLSTLAARAGDQLLAIEASQRKIKQQIEDYQGDDWDDKYGSTGLWRKLSADLYITAEYKGQIDFYLALTIPQPQRNKILHKILTQIDISDTTYHSAESQLLRARIYSLLSRTDSSYKPLATQEFDLLILRSDMRQSTAFRIAIERIKQFGPATSDQLKTLAEDIAKSKCKDNIELVLSLAFLQRIYEPESLENTVQIWPQIEDFLGSLALSDLSNRVKENRLTKQYLQQLSVFEAELAASGAWKNKTKDYKKLLTCLSGKEKFQTPLILYVAAIALADSSPADVVNLLIKASLVQQLQKSDMLKIKAHEIARQAAQLAYNLYTRNTDNCQLAVGAFENYYTMAVEKIDEKLEYLYTTILYNCDQAEKSKILLEKIANQPAGSWHKRAKLDLIKTALQQHQSANPEKIGVILKQLDTFIKELRLSNQDNKLRTEAIKIYCRLTFQSKQIASAWKVLDVLADSDIIVDPNLNILKANALRQIGRLEESADCLLAAIGLDSTDYVTEAIALLSEIVNKIDQLQERSNDFPKLVGNCEKIARYCERISLSTFGLVPVSKARLYLAEISVFAALNKQDKLSIIEKLLDDLPSNDKNDNANFTRCRARLLTAQGKFAEAARLWAHLAGIQKNDLHKTTQRPWKWWRAKFYELDCFAKIPQTEKQGVLHTIEVLESSYTEIPLLWAEKLKLLKQKCRYPEK